MLVISIRAGGRGLNLPAANHVFHFDRWWNPAVEQQATDRAYRFGQHKDVFVHSLICTATLEERIDELLDSKRELAEKVVAGRADDWLGELDLDAIRAAVVALGRLASRRRHDARSTKAARSSSAATTTASAAGRGRAGSQRPSSPTRARRAPSAGGSSPAPGTSTASGSSPGEISALVIGSSGAEYGSAIAADPVPPRVWAAVIGSPRGRTLFEAAAAGREQSLQLEHVMTVDWDEPLIPPGTVRASHRAPARTPTAAAPAST